MGVCVLNVAQGFKNIYIFVFMYVNEVHMCLACATVCCVSLRPGLVLNLELSPLSKTRTSQPQQPFSLQLLSDKARGRSSTTLAFL